MVNDLFVPVKMGLLKFRLDLVLWVNFLSNSLVTDLVTEKRIGRVKMALLKRQRGLSFLLCLRL